MLRLASVLLLALLSLSTSTAVAQDLREAQRLFERGVELSDADRWGEAAEYFRRAREIVERPSIVCNLGIALHHLGQAADATEALLRCQQLAAENAEWGSANAELVARTEHLLAELRPARGRLSLTVEPPDAEVLVDGDARAGTGSLRELDLDPGSHRVTVSAPGHVTWRQSVSILSGADVVLVASLERLPERPGVLVVESVDGAQIFVNDEHVGVGGAEVSLAAGDYRVRIEATGHDSIRHDVHVSEGERTTIDATFGNSDIASEPAFWIAIGGGAVAVGIAIAVAVVLSQPSDPLAGYTGTSGVVLVPLVSF